jgi:GDP-L-fucose synthase
MKDKNILLTGGNGFLGKHVYSRILKQNPKRILCPSRKSFDLTDRTQVTNLFKVFKPDIVIHLAAEVGGIGANMKNPGRYFYANIIMGVNLIEESRITGVNKFIQVGSVCSYPKFTKVPFKEEDIWAGYPEETNAPYGIAKKALLVMLQAYRDQYKFNGIYLLPVNLYGPCDNFNLETSHVIPALINKLNAVKGTKDPVVCWGTGKASREFVYVDDCADAIVLATERYSGREPVNIGSGREITIKDLVEKIRKIMKMNNEIRWDSTKPDGQPRRCLDISKAEALFGFRAKTTLDDGLENTINWYNNNIKITVHH